MTDGFFETFRPHFLPHDAEEGGVPERLISRDGREIPFPPYSYKIARDLAARDAEEHLAEIVKLMIPLCKPFSVEEVRDGVVRFGRAMAKRRRASRVDLAVASAIATQRSGYTH